MKVNTVKNMGQKTIVLIRGSNLLVLDEAEWSLHDVLCVIRCLVNKSFIIIRGGAAEIEISRKLGLWAKTL